MKRKIFWLKLMISDIPKATNVVWNKHPVTRPRTVNKPAFFPLYRVLDKTNILSGPGDKAIKKLAIVNDNIISKLFYYIFNKYKY